ncbi:MAG TPA: ThuA domain-containing protein, partial [Candidatus Binatia bacterium]|nr:ThuA domain-containing protein [Candidatus Binatia bacterium]
MKRALVICGDAWHPAEVVRRGLESLCSDGFAFEFVEGEANRLMERLAEFSVVVLARANMVSAADRRPWLTPDLATALREYAWRGNGLMMIHAGTSRYEQLPGMKELIGGAFERHPDQCTVTLEPCAAHPLVAGVAEFTVHDEHYFMAMTGAPV